MPSSATITSWFVFQADTNARAERVNNNFDTFRGHIIPVDPNTATAINNSYDLGSTDYRWRRLYTAKHYLGDTTTDASLMEYSTTNYRLSLATSSSDYFLEIGGQDKIQISSNSNISDLATSLGVYYFRLANVNKALFTRNGLHSLCWNLSQDSSSTSANINYSTTAQNLTITLPSSGDDFNVNINSQDKLAIGNNSIQFDTADTTGNMYIRFGGVTVGLFDINGLGGQYVNQVATASSSCNTQTYNTTTYTDITNLSVTLPLLNRRARIEMIGDLSSNLTEIVTGSPGSIAVTNVKLRINRNGTQIHESSFAFAGDSTSGWAITPNISIIDDAATASSNTYVAQIKKGSTNYTDLTVSYFKLYASLI